MKKVQQRSLRIINYFITALLSMFGISCAGRNHPVPEYGNPNPPTIAMYGVPYSTYQVMGRVENTQGNPIKNIEVEVMESGETTLTGTEGLFILKGRNRFRPNTIHIIANDVDSIENGHYENDTIIITPDYHSNLDESSWSNGHAEIDDVKIILKKKKK